MTEPANLHILPDDILHRPIKIHVIGCGGTGSQLLPRLPSLSKCLIELGHPHGLEVSVWDDDTVAEHNCLRQNFFLPDVGHNKASVMVNRINVAHGLSWQDRPERFTRDSIRSYEADFIIGCVDSKAARRELDAFVRDAHNTVWWIDSGNDAVSAQVIVGQYGKRIADDPMRLPLVTELYPEIIAGDDDNAPSCSARESIMRQGIGTNAMAASWIFAWLAEALRNGRIGWNGVFFNLESGRASSIPVSPEAWRLIRPVAAVEQESRKAA